MNMAATHARGKIAVDKIFGAGAKAQQAINRLGREQVVNGTQGVLLSDQGQLVCLPTVEKVLRNLPTAEMIAYAPIRGLPDFLADVVASTFGEYRPDAYIQAVATAGGAGALHHSIWNYSEIGDTVLTTDWFWTPYRVLCQEALRRLDTFPLFDDKLQFNLQAFADQAARVLAGQDSLLVIFNTPAHNPTGYSLSAQDWEGVLAVCRQHEARGKRITLLLDAAYLDFAGSTDSKRLFKQFEKLPAGILTIVAVSMSKSFTVYGQRVGAMIGISSDKEVMEEFVNINEYTSRATWSNINRGAMQTLTAIYRDPGLAASLESERDEFVGLIRQRAQIFIQEAAAVQLGMLPYIAGFFLSLPTSQPDAVCDKLAAENIYLVPLEKGVRIAVCAIPTAKMPGLAAAVKRAFTAVGE
ncbi:MAG: aminotransferase class I/II-fold pyridoxal phosphate-dependent enzyme [Sporomusaceae bacterium]|nr:aminotransferase class I/II-fold pyridoxal phosphate-dependent enzyme [Sporomusaceae bacterium]